MLNTAVSCFSFAGAVWELCSFLGRSAGVQGALVQLSAAPGCRMSERLGGLAGAVGLQTSSTRLVTPEEAVLDFVPIVLGTWCCYLWRRALCASCVLWIP